jgi:hypothetical protein
MVTAKDQKTQFVTDALIRLFSYKRLAIETKKPYNSKHQNPVDYFRRRTAGTCPGNRTA